MSRDFTFKENMELHKISGMPKFGTFCAKYDKNELFIDSDKPKITNIADKLKLFEKILKEHTEIGSTNFDNANCVDVANFLLDYLEEMNLFNEKKTNEIVELKETLEELTENNGTLGARETFEFILSYCNQIKLFKNEIEVEER